MYLVSLKTAITKAMKMTFDAGYPEEDFRGINIGIEYPVTPQDYPGIWINYEAVGNLNIVGIGHLEFDEDEIGASARAFTRWQFQGRASFTAVAMTSLERDRLYDELVKIIAFGQESGSTSEFRAYITDNEYLALDFDWDEIENMGFAETVGTPWQTDDVLYEATVAVEVIGEFISDSQDNTLIPLEEIIVTEYHDQEPDPTDEEEGAWI